VVRWNKGWLSLIALGAAYGIVEEGLMVKSFFDPNWMDLGPLGVYGRFAGVNWVWSVDLTIYHAVFSITIPVLLTERLFPGQRGRSWLSTRGLRSLSLLMAADVAFGFFALTPYRPPAIPYMLAAALAIALVWCAKRLPSGQSAQGVASRTASRPLAFLVLGFAGTIGFFILTWAAPNTATPPLALIALTLGFCILAWRLGRWMAGRRSLPPCSSSPRPRAPSASLSCWRRCRSSTPPGPTIPPEWRSSGWARRFFSLHSPARRGPSRGPIRLSVGSRGREAPCPRISSDTCFRKE